MEKIVRQVALAFREGSSDKVYNAAIVEEADGKHAVKVEWGRRGSTLAASDKGRGLTLEAAEKAYSKVVNEKTSKGYKPVGGQDRVLVGAVPGPKEKVVDGAQLANSVTEEEAEKLILDDGWVAQRKLDGVRLQAVTGGKPTFANRKGQAASPPREVEESLAAVVGGTHLDGELVAGVYWVFDILARDADSLRGIGYAKRHAILASLKFGPAVKVAPLATGAKAKRDLVDRLRSDRAEGVVFKRADAAWSGGKPASGGPLRKLKFVKTCEVSIVGKTGNAYRMAMADGKTPREVGKVYTGTTEATRKLLDAALATGKPVVAEVRYLYATEKRVLYQPVFVRIREDKDLPDRLSDLVVTNREVDDGDEDEPAQSRVGGDDVQG